MRYLLLHYIITLVNSFKYEIYDVFDALKNNDSIWETNENEIVRQIKDINLSDEKNDSKNDDLVNEKVNLKIFELSKKDSNSEDDKMNVDENHEIIEISSDE